MSANLSLGRGEHRRQGHARSLGRFVDDRGLQVSSRHSQQQRRCCLADSGRRFTEPLFDGDRAGINWRWQADGAALNQALLQSWPGPRATAA